MDTLKITINSKIFMKKIFGYFFNRIFKMFLFLSLEDKKEESRVPLRTWLFCSIITGFFIIDIILFSDKLKGLLIAKNGILYMCIFLITGTLLYFITIFKKKYIYYLELYENQSKNSITIGNIAILLWTAITIILFIAKTTSPILK